MENDSLPTENIKSSKDQPERVDSYSANPNQIVYDLLHQSDFDINVTDAYFAKKVNAPNKPNEYTYLKLNQARLGDKIYLVVKCYGKPPKGSLVISIRELEKKGNEQNLYPQKSISFLVNGVEKTELQFTIDEKIEYIQEIEIRPKDDKEYQELQNKLNNLENKSTRLTIRTEIKDTNATKVNFKGILTGEFDAVKGARYYDFLNEEFILKSETKIITYHIYSDGKIEKHIPKTINDDYKNKYQYVYHDKEGIEHKICTAEWHKTKEKQNGIIYSNKPTHSKIIEDNNVIEGNTRRRIKYENGDIAEYGKHPTKGNIWRLYKSTGKEIKLIRMPDQLDYRKNNIKVQYTFSQTQRRYTSPNVLAGFIGALADCNLKLVTTGSCFRDASCFPSSAHVNGKSIDTLYLDNLNEQIFINAMHKFNFNKQITGAHKKKFNNAIQEKSGTLHDTHLHSEFKDSTIQIKNED